MSKTVILIPSRLSATRMPGKPLLKINGVSIISHVYKKAKEADIGEVYVATEDKEILDEVNLAIQINGKTRDVIKIKKDMLERDVDKIVKTNLNLKDCFINDINAQYKLC